MGDEQRAGARRELVERGRWRGEATAQRKDGSTVSIEASNVVILDGDGEVIGFLGIHREIGWSEDGLEAAREEERSRIARELHDGALKSLANAIALAVGPGSGSLPDR